MLLFSVLFHPVVLSFLKCLLAQCTHGCWDLNPLQWYPHSLIPQTFTAPLLFRKILVFLLCFSFTLTLQSHNTSEAKHVQIVTYTSGQWGLDSGFQQLLSLDSINLLEPLTEHRETVCLMDYWCIRKGRKSHMSCNRASYGERAHSFHALLQHVTLPEPPRVHQPESSLNLAFLSFYWGFLT